MRRLSTVKLTAIALAAIMFTITFHSVFNSTFQLETEVQDECVSVQTDRYLVFASSIEQFNNAMTALEDVLLLGRMSGRIVVLPRLDVTEFRLEGTELDRAINVANLTQQHLGIVTESFSNFVDRLESSPALRHAQRVYHYPNGWDFHAGWSDCSPEQTIEFCKTHWQLCSQTHFVHCLGTGKDLYRISPREYADRLLDASAGRVVWLTNFIKHAIPVPDDDRALIRRALPLSDSVVSAARRYRQQQLPAGPYLCIHWRTEQLPGTQVLNCTRSLALMVQRTLETIRERHHDVSPPGFIFLTIDVDLNLSEEGNHNLSSSSLTPSSPSLSYQHATREPVDARTLRDLLVDVLPLPFHLMKPSSLAALLHHPHIEGQQQQKQQEQEEEPGSSSSSSEWFPGLDRLVSRHVCAAADYFIPSAGPLDLRRLRWGHREDEACYLQSTFSAAIQRDRQALGKNDTLDSFIWKY